MRKAADPKAQQAALSLLAQGLATPGELAELAGVSRQLVESWAKSAGINWRHVKRARLTKAWRHEIMGERPLSRKKLRKDGETLKEHWDKSHGRNSKVPDKAACALSSVPASRRRVGIPG